MSHHDIDIYAKGNEHIWEQRVRAAFEQIRPGISVVARILNKTLILSTPWDASGMMVSAYERHSNDYGTGSTAVTIHHDLGEPVLAYDHDPSEAVMIALNLYRRDFEGVRIVWISVEQKQSPVIVRIESSSISTSHESGVVDLWVTIHPKNRGFELSGHVLSRNDHVVTSMQVGEIGDLEEAKRVGVRWMKWMGNDGLYEDDFQSAWLLYRSHLSPFGGDSAV